MEEFFKISEYQDCWILRADNGVRQDIFDEIGVRCTGPVIEAAVFYISAEYEVEDFRIEFDTDSTMFCAYSENKRRLTALAELLNEVFSDDDRLREVLESEDVKEASMIEESLASISAQTPAMYEKLGIDPEKELSPEDISGILSSLF